MGQSASVEMVVGSLCLLQGQSQLSVSHSLWKAILGSLRDQILA